MEILSLNSSSQLLRTWRMEGTNKLKLMIFLKIPGTQRILSLHTMNSKNLILKSRRWWEKWNSTDTSTASSNKWIAKWKNNCPTNYWKLFICVLLYSLGRTIKTRLSSVSYSLICLNMLSTTMVRSKLWNNSFLKIQVSYTMSKK